MNNRVLGIEEEEQRGGVRSYVGDIVTFSALLLFVSASAGLPTAKMFCPLRRVRAGYGQGHSPVPAVSRRSAIPKDSRYPIINEHDAGRARGLNKPLIVVLKNPHIFAERCLE